VASACRMSDPLANISETVLVLLFNEQGEKEKGRDDREFSWSSFLWSRMHNGAPSPRNINLKSCRRSRPSLMRRCPIEGEYHCSMSSKPVAFLRAGLGVAKTHSRPYVWTSPIVSTPSASQTSVGTASGFGSLADENGLALFEAERGLMVVDHRRGEQAQPRVAVFFVVPVEKSL
jgi:hypothetical protein